MLPGIRIRITKNNTHEDFIVAAVHMLNDYVTRLDLSNGETMNTWVDIIQTRALTGNPNLDVQILAKVDDAVLNTLADVDPDSKRLFQRQELWYAKIEHKFGEAVLQFKALNISAQEFYTQLLQVYDEIARFGANITLLNSTKKNDRTAVRIAVHAGADVNAAGMHGSTALMYAAEKGHLGVVQELIQAGADVHAANMYGTTALMLAAEKNHLEIVKELLDHNANINAVNETGDTALMRAAENGNLKIVQELIARGADVNVVDDDFRWTALMLAAMHGHSKTVRELIKHTTNVNAVDNAGYTALMQAAMNGHSKVVQELLARGADVTPANEDGETALVLASQHDHHYVADLIRAHEAPPIT